mmetsp:Transcript_168/g.231  ORF Transcript_168/g.231 Transcript_168/m.231 type:complete len:135 (-) Transcript_168:757-1161(-)
MFAEHMAHIDIHMCAPYISSELSSPPSDPFLRNGFVCLSVCILSPKELLLGNLLLQIFKAGYIALDTLVLPLANVFRKSRISTGIQKQVYHLLPPTIRGPGQWRVAIAVNNVNIGVGVQESTNNVNITIGCRQV